MPDDPKGGGGTDRDPKHASGTTKDDDKNNDVDPKHAK